MALDIQSVPLSQQGDSALDGVLRHHLQLEPPLQQSAEGDDVNALTVEFQKRKPNHKGTVSQPPMKFGTQNPRQVPNQSTIESDNKRVSRRNSTRYESPSPEPPDPNSEAKSVTINRMQGNLQEWDKQLKDILEKKTKNDSICGSELASRDQKLKELGENYSTEHKLRVKTENQKDKLTAKLKNTQEELVDNKQQVEQLQQDLAQYQLAYQELEAQNTEFEREVALNTDQLEKSEGMRRRLNDQVTELQGQLAIEEQRSKLCTIL